MDKVRVDDLVAVGLKGSEARALLGLLALPDATGTSSEIAKAAALPRTAVYGYMQSLVDRGLVTAVASVGPSRWTAGSWEALLKRLDSVASEALDEYRRRLRTLSEREPPAGA